jgi:hypothetical protein
MNVKDTLLRVEFDVLRLEAFERDIEVVNQIVGLLGFDYNVINVGFDGWPDVFPENMLQFIVGT